jgi:hypothetical protein
MVREYLKQCDRAFSILFSLPNPSAKALAWAYPSAAKELHKNIMARFGVIPH